MASTVRALDPTRTGRDADRLDQNLHKRIVGQDEAITHVVNIYQTFLAGMSSPGRPVGNFLFLGPTGSGKTRMVEATAESLLGDARAVIKIDCAEFQHSHEIAKLIGSPPGYLGHRETHPLLSQEVLNQYQSDKVKLSFVLFDEIEKASDALWNLLLGILDKATLTLGDNRRVDFSRALIFMTSNLGAAEMSALLNPAIGFTQALGALAGGAAGAPITEKLAVKITSAGVAAARRKFTPEFMNRLDKVVVFKPLGDAELRRILDLELAMVQRRVFTNAHGTPFLFKLTDGAKDYLLREGTDVKYGARHLKRAIERSLVYPISNLIATEQVKTGDLVRVDYDPAAEAMSFVREAEGMPAYAMVEASGVEPAVLFNADAAAAVLEPPKPAGARSTRK
ncbi:MAG TPA: AAA family ATPase [Bryobacterales bacterium]|nr:AAA family ATPase [Bryobacterales bacterium]